MCELALQGTGIPSTMCESHIVYSKNETRIKQQNINVRKVRNLEKGIMAEEEKSPKQGLDIATVVTVTSS